MNIHQFEKLILSLYNTNTRLIKKASKLKTQEGIHGDYKTIELYDGKKRVGFLAYDADSHYKTIDVGIVIIQNEYRNGKASWKLLKEFKKIYDEKYDGYNIKADFANHKLSDTVEKIFDKYFPNVENLTEKDEFYENEEEYNDWDKKTEEEFFEINRRINFDELPEPYKIYDNNNSFVFKNPSQEQINNITNEIDIVAIKDHKDIYIGFINEQALNIYEEIINDTNAQTMYEKQYDGLLTIYDEMYAVDPNEIKKDIEIINNTLNTNILNPLPVKIDFIDYYEYINNMDELTTTLNNHYEKINIASKTKRLLKK